MNRMSNALLAGDIEEALLTVRRESYEEGYNAGRSVLILKDISTPLTHADKRSEHHDDEIHNNAVGNHARKLSTHARAQKGRAGFFAHRHARDASRAAAHHHKEMARFAHGLGDKDRAHRHEGAAQNHEANAEYHEKRRQDHKTERKKKGLLSRILRKGVDPSSQEEIALVVKAINTAKRRKDWISEKIAIIMKDGIRGHHVSQAQAVAVAHRLWEKKRNRRLPPAEAKSMDVEIVWVSLGGIVVAPDKIQFKETDGAADGLNEERRNEEHNKEFDPLKVPPIGVWHNPQDHQIYVVDGHKRVAEAKKRGLPTLRAFFIEAESFEDAKKKGERLNERMGTKSIDDDIEDALNIKAKDAKGHEHAPKGSSKGGQFVSTGGAGGTTKEKGQKITEKTLAKKTMTQKVAPLAQRIKDAVKWQKQNPEEHKEVYSQSHTKVLSDVRERHASTGLLDTTKATPGFASGYDSGRERPESKENYVNENQFEVIRAKAMAKVTQMHPAQYPTKEEIKDNLKKIADYGGDVNAARRTITGNNGDRRQRKIALAEQFGDGKRCGCVYCGLKISFSPKFAEDHIEEDKIIDTKAGGRYRAYNILPACGFCNSSRGNKDAIATLQSSKYMKGPSAS